MLKPFHKFGFLKSYVYPAFWLFLLPAFSLWFYDHAASRYDNDFIKSHAQKHEPTPALARTGPGVASRPTIA
jgi:hypothetical protein